MTIFVNLMFMQHSHANNYQLTHYRPELALMAPGGWGSQNFQAIGTWRWQGCQAHAPAALSPRRHSWQSFLLQDGITPRSQCGHRIKSKYLYESAEYMKSKTTICVTYSLLFQADVWLPQEQKTDRALCGSLH